MKHRAEVENNRNGGIKLIGSWMIISIWGLKAYFGGYLPVMLEENGIYCGDTEGRA